MYKVGFDVHKRTTTGAVIDCKGNIHRKGKFETTIGNIFKFIEGLPLEFIEIGMESSTYIYPLYDALTEKGYSVRVAHAKKLRRITHCENKNDDKDAEDIARQLLVRDFPDAFILTKERRENRELIRLRVKLVQERTRYKNRIRMFMARHHIKLKEKSPFTKKGIRELLNFPLPEYAKRSLTILVKQFQRVVSEIKNIDKELTILEKKFEKEITLLRSIPYIGQFSALAFITELAEFSRFKNVKNLSAYVGYVPKMAASGDKRYHGRMRFDGNKTIRYAFNRAAENAVRYNNEFADYYKRLRPQKKRRTAIAAVAHKMMRVCYGVLMSGKPYTRSGSYEKSG